MADFVLNEIISAVSGELIQGSPDRKVTGLSIDSRKIQPGDLFVAIKGEQFDGHDFVPQAVIAGAAAVIIMDDLAVTPGFEVVKVQDTITALGAIARLHRRRYRIPVLGITGSNGKTTTKDLVASVLAQQWPVIKTEGNFNNEIGMPLTILNIGPETKAAVIEMGMRGLGQIRQLAEIAEPNIGIVTNVGLTHLELLGSQARIAEAKGEMVQSLPLSGLAILNGDDALVREMQCLNKGRTVFYGIEGPGLDYRAGDIKIRENGSVFKVYAKGEIIEVQLPVPGRHNILNSLAAIAAGRELGMPNEAIRKGLAQPNLTGKRLNIMRRNGFGIIDDTYNASPTSVKASLDVLKAGANKQRKIAVLADMLELGPTAAQIHREIGEYAAGLGIDYLFSYGDLAREYTGGFNRIAKGKAVYFNEKAQLISYLYTFLQPGDLVLVKGSRGMKMEDIVVALSEMEVEV